MTNQIYIANLGKYNEGILQGAWFSFPVDMEEVANEIGLNAQYEEWAIHDYEFDFPLTISEYANIDKLNELVETIEENDDLVELFDAMQNDKWNTDRLGELAMNAFNEMDITHDIVDDEWINEEIKTRMDNGTDYVGIKYFLQNADNNSTYHILDGYENIDRLTTSYIENLISDNIDELKRELGF